MEFLKLAIAIDKAAYDEAMDEGLLGDEFWAPDWTSAVGVLRLVNYFFAHVSDPEATPALNEVIGEAIRADADYLLLLMEDYS